MNDSFRRKDSDAGNQSVQKVIKKARKKKTPPEDLNCIECKSNSSKVINKTQKKSVFQMNLLATFIFPVNWTLGLTNQMFSLANFV